MQHNCIIFVCIVVADGNGGGDQLAMALLQALGKAKQPLEKVDLAAEMEKRGLQNLYPPSV